MPIRANVGRRSKDRHCQNWKDDQQVVIDFLNKIPAAWGGAEGSLKGRVVAGLASNELYQAILRFQKEAKFKQTGFVEPNSEFLSVMDKASRAPKPKPRKAGEWDNMTSGPIFGAVYRALDDDGQYSHAEVISILRATLSDGMVQPYEMNDLKQIIATSTTMPPRSRKLLSSFFDKVDKIPAAKGPYTLPTDNHKFAAQAVCDFLEKSGGGVFSKLDRDEVGVGLLMRLANPGLMHQSGESLCGPASLLFSLAEDKPKAYAQLAIDLFEKGQGKVDYLTIKPGADCRSAGPTSQEQVDWMTMASIRDSENVLWDFDSLEDEDSGTKASEIASWFRRSGYSDIRNKVTKSSSGVGTIVEANDLYNQGYRVVLFINANMLREANQAKHGGKLNHVVVQRTPIDVAGGNVKVKVFTWGDGFHQIPNGATQLSVTDFLGNLFGYVAAKP